jgi:hypothetical protein
MFFQPPVRPAKGPVRGGDTTIGFQGLIAAKPHTARARIDRPVSPGLGIIAAIRRNRAKGRDVVRVNQRDFGVSRHRAEHGCSHGQKDEGGKETVSCNLLRIARICAEAWGQTSVIKITVLAI